MMDKKPVCVLIASPDADLHRSINAALADHGHFQLTSCVTGQEVLNRFKEQSFQLLYADMGIDDPPAAVLIETVKREYPEVYVAAGSASGTAQDVVAALQAGAVEFIVDPSDSELVWTAFQKAVRDIGDRSTATVDEFSSAKTMITQDQRLLGVLDIARKVAPSSATILIGGESGTGKELLATFIHAHSQRQNEPYMAVNCAALPDQLAESELFGHAKGAFTGAISKKIGKFESAGQGTLVLDEISEMALPLQAKLLRALQEKEIVRLGSNRPIPIAARVIAISNQVLKKAVASGSFREDLFYRLNVIPLTIPPLRERKNDIPILAEAFLQRFSHHNNCTMTHISKTALELLMDQNWDGNVRELENTIERGVLIGSGETLLPEHLILDEPCLKPAPTGTISAGMTVREMEKQLITDTLRTVKDNRTHAAKMLGISIRTLRNKLNEYRQEMESGV